MGDEAFTHDVFLSHSTKDKAVVHAVAERLRKDGLQVWFELAPEGPRTRISEAPRGLPSANGAVGSGSTGRAGAGAVSVAGCAGNEHLAKCEPHATS